MRIDFNDEIGTVRRKVLAVVESMGNQIRLMNDTGNCSDYNIGVQIGIGYKSISLAFDELEEEFDQWLEAREEAK